MSEKRPTNAKPHAPATGESPAGGSPALENTSGRVTFDSRGNAKWEWRTGDGEFKTDASTSMVRSLEPQGLALESTTRIQRLVAGTADKDKSDAPSARKSEPWSDVRGHSTASMRIKAAKAAQAQVPGHGGEASGFDPYNSGRSVSHVRKAARRPVAKPTPKPAEPERKGLLARLTGRKP
ncbi:MAG: hypothetical protein U1F09_00880 [Steroidobacteraceae bacterium]